MSDDVPFDRSFAAKPGQVDEVSPGIRRIVAPNPGPFTFTGTNTFLVGTHDIALIDPGPLDDGHRAAIEAALEGQRLAAIIVTHTHRDHSPLARPLAEAHDAPVYAYGPHTPARPPRPGESSPLDSAGDTDFAPDIAVSHGDAVDGDGWRFVAVHTPGHTANHICLELAGTGTLFSGDHVMAWSTTVVAPPDGSMADYMASLDRLLAREDKRYLPAHGGAIERPRRFVQLLALHRRQREAAILRRIEAGDAAIADIVQRIYKGLDPRLVSAAALSVLAHIESLVERGAVTCEGPPRLDSRFRPA
jgi:glyoxylase-like metal-dependent hydrolase (beta-lactamase superfamily II)